MSKSEIKNADQYEKQKVLSKIQDIQNLNKFKLENDFEKFDSDPNKSKNYMKIISTLQQMKSNSSWIIEYTKYLENEVQQLQETLANQQQVLLIQPQSPIKKESSLSMIRNLSKEKLDIVDMSQSKKIASILMDQSVKIKNQDGAGINLNELIEKDKLIQELYEQISAKDQDLQIAAQLEDEHSQLQEAVHFLEKQNQELKKQFEVKIQNQNDQVEVDRLKDEILHLNRQNQFYCEQYELLKQKQTEQDTTLEYLVAENSRLIIKSFALQNKKYKI